MAKQTTSFICQQCGYVSPRFMGKCPECQAWNTLVETVNSQSSRRSLREVGINRKTTLQQVKPLRLSDIVLDHNVRISTGIGELDHVLGGGLVPGQVVLLAGEPGVGKSTLLLQIIGKTSIVNRNTLYVSGEESPQQLSIRAKRLKIDAPGLALLAETNIEAVIEHVQQNTKHPYTLLIIDSIQTMWSDQLAGAPGSVGQVRESAYSLIQHAKYMQIPMIIVGQVTKEGTIAGPKVLEHLVDTVLSMEGSRFEELRLVRVSKNRFGPTDETGVFAMRETGLIEVTDPTGSFYTKRDTPVAGHAAIVAMEGSRPLVAEVQALVAPTELKNPRRVANGIASMRLVMLVAILSKHLRLPLEQYDVYVTVTGGLRVEEPAADLGIAMAIYSSMKNKPLPQQSVFIGELSLLGEIQPVSHSARRRKEATRAGLSALFAAPEHTALRLLVGGI